MSQLPDLEQESVETLVRRYDWGEVLAALREVETWTNDLARKLDVYFLHHTIRLLRVATSRETLLDFADTLARAAHPRRAEQLDALDQRYTARWLGWRDLLDARIEALGAPVESAIRKRTHLMEVLQTLGEAGGELDQGQIAEKHGLKGPNLTRIMAMLEGAEMIERHKKGQRKTVVLTPAARALVTVKTDLATHAPRGQDLFSRKAA